MRIDRLKTAVLAAVALAGAAAAAGAITGEEVIRLMEANQTHKTEQGDGQLLITDRFGKRTKTFRYFAEGSESMLIEFTNPEERGQKILRLENEIYLYFPDAEEVIHLQGSALKESVMGSDFSYEDLTGEKELLDLYQVRLLGRESLAGIDCYLLELKGRKRGVAYPLQKVWVEVERLVLRQGEYYALSGRLLKTLEVKRVERIDGKNIPVDVLMKDAMKKSSSTEFKVSNLRIDEPLPQGVFSLERLSW